MKSILKNTYVIIAILLYTAASVVKIFYYGVAPAEPVMTFAVFIGFFGFAMWLLSRNARQIEIQHKGADKSSKQILLWFAGWLILYILFGNWLLDHKLVSNIIGFWVLLAVIPFFYLLGRGCTLRDMGITFQNIGQNIRISLMACIVLGIFLTLMTPGGKFLTSGTLGAVNLLYTLVVAFGYGLFFAAIFEEFFFRGVMQSHISQWLKSDISAIAIASILFGIYHFPFQFFGSGPSEGDLLLSISNVLTEQMISGPVFGILWARTRSLIVPVIVHGVIDAISGLPAIAEMLGFIN